VTSPSSGRVPTIKDVAALAGVSWKTVTNVVHERSNVAPATRARVLAAIEKLDYHPDIAGRSLRRGRSHALTLVAPDIVNPYFSMLVEAVFAVADKRGYAVFVETAGRRPVEEQRAASSLLRFAFDGEQPGEPPIDRRAVRDRRARVVRGVWPTAPGDVIIDYSSGEGARR
jgi:hypothetical protein